MSTPRRKNIRIHRNEYLGTRIYFLTICTENRLAIFQNSHRATAAIESLKSASSAMNFLVHAFCIMPDHVHLLVQATCATSDVIKFVARWKRTTGHIFRNELPPRFWQRRFYDHVLRKASDCERVAWYIWMNPVRKGLVAEPHLYPFSGSFTVEWPKKPSSISAWLPPWKVLSHGQSRPAREM